MAILIFANGDMNEVAWVREAVDSAEFIIAADGGCRHLHRLNHPPNIVIGDGDSLDAELSAWLDAHNVPRITHPTAKDETDLELALLYAVEHSAENIYIYGARGGRLDQELANIMLLALPQLAGRRTYICDPHQRAWLLQPTSIIEGSIGDTVSLIPLGGSAHIARTQGLAWPLIDSELSYGPARGVSNRLTQSTATIQVAAGNLLCIHTPLGWER